MELFCTASIQSARPDLQWIDGEQEVVEQVVAQQFRVQEQGLGDHFPNAMHYVIEKLDTAIGALTTDFGPNEIRVLYLAFIPQARGQAMAARCCKVCRKPRKQVRCPVATVLWANNTHARQHYLALGFQIEASLLAIGLSHSTSTFE
jgi:hypothetical protein